VCESRLVFAGRRHVLAPAGMMRRITHLTRLIRHLTRLPCHDTYECMCWRQMGWFLAELPRHELPSRCRECMCARTSLLRRCTASSRASGARRVAARVWRPPPQLLALLAAAAALRSCVESAHASAGTSLQAPRQLLTSAAPQLLALLTWGALLLRGFPALHIKIGSARYEA